MQSSPGCARLHLVGRKPVPEVGRLSEVAGVEVVGEVPDVRPHVARAALVVAPLRIARGVQNKVLEGMAMPRPVVASPAAVQGLPRRLNPPLLQAAAGALAIDVSAIAANDDQRTAVFTLNGVVLEGFVHVVGDLGKLRLIHSTLIPGRQLDGNGNPVATDPSVSVEPLNGAGKAINLLLRIEAAFSILGQLAVPTAAAGIWLLDCIAQGTAASPVAVAAATVPLVTERSTFFGAVPP